ncbi:DUF2834 domain-containing protein [Roseovarius tibetensis]|uniref:DUF2834 domain-containing protein n=1 Tax=Roseovarius tibetensis TaxID=2685897 RepID=UPI003D7F921E
MRWVFAALALWGAVHPMYYFMSYMAANDWSLGALIDAWYVNDSTTGLTWDLTIAAIALTVWVLVEVVQRRHWMGLIAVPATFCIGVSCGLPLYIFLRLSRDAKRGI